MEELPAKMEFIKQQQKAQNKAEGLKVEEEIAETRTKMEIYRSSGSKLRINQIYQMTDRQLM